MKKNGAFRRVAALMAALSITVSLAAPAFAGTYYIDDGDITITKDENGQTVKQGNNEAVNIGADEEIIITTHKKTITSLESDLEGPAAEDTGFGPVVEENYQQEDAEESEDDDRQESAEEPKSVDQPENTDRQEDADQQESADRQAQPQQAALTAADDPATSTPANGFCDHIITVINKAATALKLTLKDVKIDVSDTGTEDYFKAGKAALSVQGSGDVEIELDGKNELKSGFSKAGLEKTSTGTLTLKDDNQKDDNQKAGSLTATGGNWAAGIGGGYKGNGKNITIKGGTVNAAGGDNGGAGIGGGDYGSGEDITITGGTVNAAGGLDGAGIGGGWKGSGKNITITGGTVNAAGGNGGSGIGGGDYGSGEDITIKGGTVTATGGGYRGNSGAGIGGGSSGSGENITINDGKVTATGGSYAAGIGGGSVGAWGGAEGGSGKNITINGGTVNATGTDGGAGIGGGENGNGEDITITGGEVKATGGANGAGIGGDGGSGGSNVTVSGAAQVTATAGKGSRYAGAGATIGGGGSSTQDSDGNTVPTPGTEIQADIKGLTTGYIHHIIYEQDGTTIKREWWEPVRPQPNPEDPNAPTEESNEVDLGTPGLHVETLEGDPLPFDAQQQGSTLRVTSNTLAARLHGTRQALEALQEQGVEQIQFVTSFKTTTLSVAELLAEGGSWFALEHNGLVSRRLSAAQAESLKCWMH